MTKSTSHRLHALAVATALVLGAVAAPAASAGQVSLAGLGSQPTHDRFIVKYRDGSTSATAMQTGLAHAAATAGVGQSLGLQHVRRIATGADLVRSSRRLDRVESESLLRQIAADPNVEYVEVDRLLHATLTPNDTSYSQQWGLQSGTAGIHADAAWDITSGSGIIAAVIDTGITTHSDLSANVIAGYDFISDTTVSNDGNGRDSNPADPGDWNTDAAQCPVGNSSWHGTHVAGTIAALTNNAKGVAGVAFSAKVMPVRALGHCGGYTSDIADAIIWASGGAVSGIPNTTTPAQIINMSLGGSGACDVTTQNAINAAVGRGTTVVVAAGNDNANASGFSPASCNNVITIGSVTSAGARSSFSNYGSLVDVSAPGSSILSTLNSGTTTPSTETYASYSGTSMATPHVVGTVALMQSRRKALGLALLTPAQVESILKSTTYPIPAGCSLGCGTGIVNAKAAVDAAAGSTPPPPPPPPGNLLRNPGFESGAVSWTQTSGVITNSTGRTPRAGSYYAWLNGYGTSHTDNLAQAVTITAGTTSATLSFYLKIDTAETGTTAYDTLKVQVFNSAGTLLKTCGTYSNVNASSGYVQRTCSLTSYIGQTVTIQFSGSEDSSLQTSFTIDDTSVTAS